VYSPVHNCLKFSVVFGNADVKSSIFRRPAGCPFILISMKTIAFSGCFVVGADMMFRYDDLS